MSALSRGDMLQYSLQAWIRYATVKGFSDFKVATALSHKVAETNDRYQVVVDPQDDQPIPWSSTYLSPCGQDCAIQHLG